MSRGSREVRDAIEIQACITFLRILGRRVSVRVVATVLKQSAGRAYRWSTIAQTIAADVAGQQFAEVGAREFALATGQHPGNGFTKAGQHRGNGTARAGAAPAAGCAENGEFPALGQQSGNGFTKAGQQSGNDPQVAAAAPPSAPANSALGQQSGNDLTRAGQQSLRETAPELAVSNASGNGFTKAGQHHGAGRDDPRAPAHVRAEIRPSSLVTGLWQNTADQTPDVPTGVGMAFNAPLVFVNTNPSGTPAMKIAGPTTAVEKPTKPDDDRQRSLPIGPVRNGGRPQDPAAGPTEAAGALEAPPAEPQDPPDAARPAEAALAPKTSAAGKQPPLLLLGKPGTPATEFPWVTELRAAVRAFLRTPLCLLDGEQRVLFGRYHAWRWAGCTKSEATNRRRGGAIAKAYGSMAHSDQFMDLTISQVIRLCTRYAESVGGTPWHDPWLLKAIDDGYTPKPLPPNPIPTTGDPHS